MRRTIQRGQELQLFNNHLLSSHPRLPVLAIPFGVDARGIPIARSKWDAVVRCVIGRLILQSTEAAFAV